MPDNLIDKNIPTEKNVMAEQYLQNPSLLLPELAASIQLREGTNGVSKALWQLYRGNAHSTREWSKSIQIPVPVLAALRRELEKCGILEADKRIKISQTGQKILSQLFQISEAPSSKCSSCQGNGLLMPPQGYEIVEEFTAIAANRPSVDVTLDQSHATPETAVRKAMLLLEKGWLHRSIVFMGDDDLISVACYLVRQRFIPDQQTPGKLAVADIDARYLEYIEEQTKASIETTMYDVRKPLPKEWENRFHIAVTDPAYTVNGITTFASRCHDVVDENGILFLSIPHKDNQSAGLIQQNLLSQGHTIAMTSGIV